MEAAEGLAAAATADVTQVGEANGANPPVVELAAGQIGEMVKLRTCHQCRQKRPDCFPLCKRFKKQKPCTLKYCTACLDNRYAQKLEEIRKLDDWSCPKCRDKCNCSFCMKRKGHQPTGQLTQTAKKRGYNSVEQLLQDKGSEILKPKDMEKDAESNGKQSDAIKNKKKGLKILKGSGCDASQVAEATCDFKVGETSAGLDNGNAEAERPSKKRRRSIKHGDSNGNGKAEPSPKAPKLRKQANRSRGESRKEEIVLPIGNPLLEVAGVELEGKDIGRALQYLEYCDAFFQVLDIRKGQPESVLRDLARGRLKRHGVHSAYVEFIIKLLSLLKKDMKKKGDAWLQTLKRCIEESRCILNDLPTEWFERGSSGFDNLDTSTKLKILNVICDELLGTEELRSWIDDVSTKSEQVRKEKKEQILDAKKKEKLLKHMTKDGLAKAVLLAQDRAPLSILESEGVISESGAKEDKVHAELLASLEALPKKNQRSDAVRTDPVRVGSKGKIFWKLNGYNNCSNIILQDVGDCRPATLQEMWFSYTEEEEKVIEMYISSSRNQKRRRDKPDDVNSDNVEETDDAKSSSQTDDIKPYDINETNDVKFSSQIDDVKPGDVKEEANSELPNNSESQQCLPFPEEENGSLAADKGKEAMQVEVLKLTSR